MIPHGDRHGLHGPSAWACCNDYAIAGIFQLHCPFLTEPPVTALPASSSGDASRPSEERKKGLRVGCLTEKSKLVHSAAGITANPTAVFFDYGEKFDHHNKQLCIYKNIK
jgi:hypothetical protein